MHQVVINALCKRVHLKSLLGRSPAGMPRAYSLDLRERLVSAVIEGSAAAAWRKPRGGVLPV
jgi:hypothetical protein